MNNAADVITIKESTSYCTNQNKKYEDSENKNISKSTPPQIVQRASFGDDKQLSELYFRRLYPFLFDSSSTNDDNINHKEILDYLNSNKNAHTSSSTYCFDYTFADDVMMPHHDIMKQSNYYWRNDVDDLLSDVADIADVTDDVAAATAADVECVKDVEDDVEYVRDVDYVNVNLDDNGKL